MIVSATTEIYTELFVKNYKFFLNWAYGDEDNVMRSYAQTLEKVLKGYTAHTTTKLLYNLKDYNKTVIKNWRLTQHGKKKNTVEIQGNDEVKTDNELHRIENIDIEERLDRQRTEIKIIHLFNYLHKHFSQEDCYVFRVYYLYDEKNKKITYKQLSQITGYSVSKVCGIIQKIKADLRENLNDYINGLEKQSGRNAERWTEV